MVITNSELPASSVDHASLERALQALARGDPWPAIRLLLPKVRWQATAQRSVAESRVLDAEGAKRYLTLMASAIASRGYKLDVVSLERTGPNIVAITVWTAPDGMRRAECANVVRFEGGEIVSVTEQA